MFPEDLLNVLPPYGLSVAWKAIIYVSIIEVFFVSLVFAAVIRRKGVISSASFEEPVSITLKTLGPDADRLDVITGLRVEIAGYQAALETLKNAIERNEISESAYNALKSYYDLKVDEVKNSLTIYSDTTVLDIDEELSQIELSDEGIAASELSEIEGALSGLSLEEERIPAPSPAPPTPSSASVSPPSPPSPPSPSSASAPPAPPAPPSPPSAPAGRPTPPSPAPPSPPSASVSPPSPPSPPSPSSAPAPPAPPSPPSASVSPPSPPSPPSPSSAPAPPAPPSAPVSKPTPPSPPKSVSAPPSASIPSPPAPSAPPKMPTEAPPPPPPPAEAPETEDEGVFAKSTSIAALRMEMLKELAKLKKLSESMGEKE